MHMKQFIGKKKKKDMNYMMNNIYRKNSIQDNTVVETLDMIFLWDICLKV